MQAKTLHANVGPIEFTTQFGGSSEMGAQIGHKWAAATMASRLTRWVRGQKMRVARNGQECGADRPDSSRPPWHGGCIYAVNLIVPRAGFMGRVSPNGAIWRTREKKGKGRLSRLTRTAASCGGLYIGGTNNTGVTKPRSLTGGAF
jgi:hypothetical protein